MSKIYFSAIYFKTRKIIFFNVHGSKLGPTYNIWIVIF